MKNLSHLKLSENPVWLQRRIREYKQLIKKEFEAVGCTDLDFDLWLQNKSLCSPKNSIHVNFVFNGVKYWGLFDVWGEKKYEKYYHKVNDLFIHIKSDNESDKEKYFRIKDIRVDLGRKLVNKITILDCLPLYRELKAVVES